MAAATQSAGPNEALRKRHQIQTAGKMMFVWVAAASLIIGVSGVGVYLLSQKIHFGNQVISEKLHTKRVLEGNIQAADDLLTSVQVLNTNPDLKRVTISDEQNPVEAVLDAMPADANSSALAASLQKRLLVGDGISLETLSVEPIAGAETGDEEVAPAPVATDTPEGAEANLGAVQPIPFSFEVTAKDPAALKKMMQRLERSIRTVTLTHTELESQGNRLRLSGQGVAYYQPKVTTIMKKVTVPRK